MPTSPTRSELFALAAVVVVGVTLRVAWPGRMAVEHFDEGVYASNVWFGPREGFEFPNRPLYAPPLVPAAIEIVFQIGGVSNLGAMFLGLAAGCLMIPLVWWVGRCWFGPAAGLVGASLCATSQPHVLFSRTCLTDVPLSLWLLLSVWLIVAGCQRRSAWIAVAGGAASGLAWWTKYNGWLPLAISLVGVAWSWFVTRGSGSENATSRTPNPEPRAPLRLLALAACTAILIWLPVPLSLGPGGYAGVLANHRRYVVGWEGWASSLFEFLRKGDLLTSGWQMPVLRTLLFALSLAAGQPERFTWNAPAGRRLVPRIVDSLAWAFALSWLSGASFMVAVLAGRELWSFLRRPASLRESTLAAWVLGLAVVTPLYTPYPRLWLPWMVGVWLVGGVAFSRFGKEHSTENTSPATKTSLCLATLLGLVLFVTVLEGQRGAVPGWANRTGTVEVARELAAEIRKESGGKEAAVYVYGEPALVFQLRLLGLPAVQPVDHLAFARPGSPPPAAPTFLIAGPHADRTAGFEQQLAEARDRLKAVAIWSWPLSPAVTLDDRLGLPAKLESARLYRVR